MSCWEYYMKKEMSAETQVHKKECCVTSTKWVLWFVCSYYKGIRQMVQVSDQDMYTHLAEISRVSIMLKLFPRKLEPKVEALALDVMPVVCDRK